MKRLILLRHGVTNLTGQLSLEGQTQIRNFARKVAQFKGKRPLILSSTAPRAVESASILSGVLSVGEEVTFERHSVLLSDSDRSEDMPALLDLLLERQDDAEVIILVTHLEYVACFPQFFGRLYLNGFEVPTYWEVDYGEGFVIDFEDPANPAIRPISQT